MTRLFSISHWRVPLGLAVLGLTMGLLWSLLLPFQRSATMRVFITQPSAAGLDPYTAIKATERIALSLSELVYTTSFFDNVLSRSKEIDLNYFPRDERLRRKLWRKTITTSIRPGTSILSVSAYHFNPNQARLIVEAVTREMVAQVPNYFGYNIRAQVIDAPLASRWFVRPHLISNALSGAALGGLLGLLFILINSVRTSRD